METILTIPAVAKYLRMSKTKVYSLVQAGNIPHIRIVKNVRVKKAELIIWLEQHTVPGQPERMEFRLR